MATTTNFGWETPDDTDLVKDGAAAMRTLGNSIDTSFVDLKGGTSGQVLAKASGTDLDFSWVAQDDSNAIQNAIVDAKGDLIAATAADTPARLAVGTNGHILTADSTAATGIKWAAPAGGGKVLQVVQATTSTATATSTTGTWIDTGLSATITPSASTSKILVMTTQMIGQTGNLNDRGWNVQLLRGSTAIFPSSGSYNTYLSITSIGDLRTTHSLHYLDSPATTSATSYKTQMMNQTGRTAVTTTANDTSQTSSIILMEIGA
jgi:hypothetical protein